MQRCIGLVEFLFKFPQKLSEMREPLHRLTRRNASGSGPMSKTMLSLKKSTTLLKNHQYSSTSARVDQQRAKEMRPRMGLAFHWCTKVSQWYLEVGRFRWQRGSITRSRSNFWSQFLAWSITINMCSVGKSSCGLIQKPWSLLCRSHWHQHSRD